VSTHPQTLGVASVYGSGDFRYAGLEVLEEQTG
jgi:hypothetical protein